LAGGGTGLRAAANGAAVEAPPAQDKRLPSTKKTQTII
jgi:hypothetical protein